MQGKVLSLICAIALARGVLSNVDPLSACSRACSACNCLPIEPVTKCSAKEAEGILLPHEQCNKFYICNHGSKVAFDCPSDLLFNPLTVQCDFPYNVPCGDRVIPEKENKNEGSEGSETNGNNTGNESVAEKVEENDDSLDISINENGNNVNKGDSDIINSNPGEAALICSAAKSDGTLVAHEVCNQYFICNHGLPVTMNCPKELLYNPYIEKCDWPHNVECRDRIIVTELEDNDSNSNNDKETDENDNSESNGACNCNPDEAPLICAVDGSEGTLVAHEECNRYFICNYGIPISMECPKGLLYNPYIEQCDWPYKVECGDRLIVEEGDGDGGASENGSNENENNNSSNGGEDDNGGHGEEDSSDGNNDNDSSEELQPQYDLFEIAKAKCAETESDGLMSIHQNCHQFYVCLKHEPALLSCPLGLYFHEEKHTCEWPQYVQCSSRIVI